MQTAAIASRDTLLSGPVPALWRLSDSARVQDGHIVMPELPGIGFKGKSDLIKVMRELTE